MKVKKLNKKLSLEKRTIANIGVSAMGKINGGALTDECTLPLSCIEVCMPDTSPEECIETYIGCVTVDAICLP